MLSPTNKIAIYVILSVCLVIKVPIIVCNVETVYLCLLYAKYIQKGFH